jgi:hypothetical protein
MLYKTSERLHTLVVNLICLYKSITPKYAKIRIQGTSRAAKRTQNQVTTLRINNELKHLYAKKQNINKQLYTLHLRNAHFWQRNWHIIEDSIDTSVHNEASQHNYTLHKKLNNLTKQSEDNYKTTNKQTFYPRLMALIEKAREGKLMNTKENFHIYLYNHANALIHEHVQQVLAL